MKLKSEDYYIIVNVMNINHQLLEKKGIFCR